MEVKIYFKKNGNLSSKTVDGFNADIKKVMSGAGLGYLRKVLGADKDSAIMAIAK